MIRKNWRCPMPDCAHGPDGDPWSVSETARDVETLVLTYARGRYGELPEPSILGPLRARRVADAIEAHLATHSPAEESDWISKIFVA